MAANPVHVAFEHAAADQHGRHVGLRRRVEILDDPVVANDQRTTASRGRRQHRRQRLRATDRRSDRLLQEATPTGRTFESHGLLGKMRRASRLTLRSASMVRR